MAKTDQLRQWIARAEKSLAKLVEVEGLHLELLRVEQGPMTITFVTRLQRPGRAALQKLLSLDKSIGQALRAANVRIVDTPEGVLIQIPSPLPWTPPGEKLADHSQGLRVALGIDETRKIAYLDLDKPDTSHLLLLGPSGRGKSQALRSILYSLAKQNSYKQALFIILAKKSQDWRSFVPSANCGGLITKPEEQEAVIKWLLRLQDTRAELGRKSPHIFLVIDDLRNVSSSANITAGLGELASMGRGVGIHLLLSTQKDGKQGGLSEGIEENLAARLVYGASTAAAGARYAGQGGLRVEKVGVAPGDCLLILHSEARRLASGYVSDTSIALLPAGELPAPWRKSEQPKTAKNRPEQERTGENSPEQASGLLPAPSSVAGANTNGRGGTPEQAPEQAKQNSLQELFSPAMSLEEIRERSLRLDAIEPPTEEQKQTIRELFQWLGSYSKTVWASYGHYNGKVRGYVVDTIEEAERTTEKPAKQQNGKTGSQELLRLLDDQQQIDLNTEEGRELLARLDKGGYLRWEPPD